MVNCMKNRTGSPLRRLLLSALMGFALVPAAQATQVAEVVRAVDGRGSEAPTWRQLPPGAAVTSAHPLATAAGIEVLAAGGNAFDAAVAVTAALAVVEPAGSGLGGGGFWLLHRGEDGFETMVDGRETAPASATPDMFIGPDGKADSHLSLNTARGAGIPGTVAAIDFIASRYGTRPLAQLLAPAIRLAGAGFPASPRFLKLLDYRAAHLATTPAAEVFMLNGEAPPAGAIIVQHDLANTLRAVASNGRDGFYQGPVAEALVAGANAAGAQWTLQDLADYEVVERLPQTFRYRHVAITTASLPSSGGVVLAQTLGMLERRSAHSLSDPDQRHLQVEAMRRAFRDRAHQLGDPDHVDVPVEQLVSDYYLDRLAEGIDITRATPSQALEPGAVADPPAGTNTTHFSIIDGAGNRVAATLSINTPFGSGQMPAGTGVLLNNELDDFAAVPGAPNVWGLVGAKANQPGAGKRPLSSMSPTFLDDGARVAVLGTPGGSRIISMVLLGILEFADGGSARSIVAGPRFHHQFLPDEVQFETGALDGTAQADLIRRGHQLRALDRRYGDMQVLVWDRVNGTLDAASDPRGEGAAAVIAVEPTGSARQRQR